MAMRPVEAARGMRYSLRMKKLLLGVAVLGAAGYGVYQWRAEAPAPAQHAELIENRIWIDHMPRTERDTIQVFLTIDEEGMGIFQASSMWKGSYELFRYEGHGGELRVVFPQTGERETLKAKATRCNDSGFDFCLDLDGGTRGVKRYYSMQDWEIGSTKELDAKLRALGTPSSDPTSGRK
jgi:hypothetical protein